MEHIHSLTDNFFVYRAELDARHWGFRNEQDGCLWSSESDVGARQDHVSGWESIRKGW